MTIIAVTKAAKAAIQRREAQAAASLRLLHKHAVASALPAIAATRHELQVAAYNNDGIIPPSFALTTHYQVVAQIRASINHFGVMAQPIIGQLLHDGTTQGAAMARVQLHASVPKGYTYGFTIAYAASPKQVARQTAVYRLFDKYGDEAATAAQDAIRQGVIAGRGPAVIARALMDATDISLISALNTSRTEAMYALRSATLANYQANSDVVESWIWFASGNACAMCLAMAGSEHSLDEDMESHNNCSCTSVPKTKSWADIFAGTGIDASDIPETTIDVPQGQDIFDSKSEAEQRDLLGPSKYNAYKAGDITLADLVGTSHSAVWGTSRYERSLKDMGLDASDYSD
jgi:hypothetical protein